MFINLNFFFDLVLIVIKNAKHLKSVLIPKKDLAIRSIGLYIAALENRINLFMIQANNNKISGSGISYFEKYTL